MPIEAPALATAPKRPAGCPAATSSGPAPAIAIGTGPAGDDAAVDLEEAVRRLALERLMRANLAFGPRIQSSPWRLERRWMVANRLAGLEVRQRSAGTEISLENVADLAARLEAVPVVGRKNYYGSGSRWSARLAAVVFSILQTLELWEINPQRWLSAYLQSCAESGNRAPPQLNRFLPWEMDPARREDWSRAPGQEAA